MEPDRISLERYCPYLPRIITSIEGSVDATAVIVHGSRASGSSDDWSDLDVLMVLRRPTSEILFEPLDGIPIDLTTGTARRLLVRMSRKNKRNSNFVLNALCSGKIWRDDKGQGSELIKEAWRLRMNGPSVPTDSELLARFSYLQKLAISVRRLSKRAAARPDGRILASMRCDTLAVESVYTYHRVRQLWASGLAPMLKKARIEAPRLYQLWNDYALASTIEEKLWHAEAIVSLAFEGKEQLIPKISP